MRDTVLKIAIIPALLVGKIGFADICVPAFNALQEKTTPENLTSYEDLKSIYGIDDNYIAEDSVEPLTMALAIAAAKGLGNEIGVKIFNSIFGPNGPRKGLTEADFKRIAAIIKEALREDAKRKIGNCIVDIQRAGELLLASWDKQTAVDVVNSAASIINNISRFDHEPSRIALMPSAILLGTIQAAVTQDLIKNSKWDKNSYKVIKKRNLKLGNDFIEFINKKTDKSNVNNVSTYCSYRKEPGRNIAFVYSIYLWKKREMHSDSDCYENNDLECKPKFEKGCNDIKKSAFSKIDKFKETATKDIPEWINVVSKSY